jgi:endonuclease-8
MRTALVGRPVTRLDIVSYSTGPRPRAGSAIEHIDVHGRHIELHFDDGIILRSRTAFGGAWHLLHPGERSPRRGHRSDIVVGVEGWTAEAHGQAEVETYRAFDQSRHPRSGRMGPDVGGPGADLHECASRLSHYDRPEVTVAEALLDPRVMVGVGNVNRCEVLWMCGIHPWAPVGSMPPSTCLDIVVACAGLARAAADPAARSATVDVPGGLAVYGRNGQRCARCGDVVRHAKIGDLSRLIFWCPGCQVIGEPFPVHDEIDPIARATDPHPAGSRFVRDILRHRPAS